MTPGDDAATYDGAVPGTPALPQALARLARIARAAPWPVVVMTAIAAALRLTSLSGVSPNPFYDAAVRSMSLSLPNFFFGAFEPGRLLSIDKPPVDLWLQVVSVKLLGWNQFALKLPEALGGTAAVPLLYDTVRRAAGRPAGLASAAVLALAPASVLTARSDTMDSVMMLLVILALWLTVRACQGGGRRMMVLAGVALGLAFEVKLLESLLCLPALLALYLLAGPASTRRRIADLTRAAAAFVVVALAWAVAVTLAPGPHPWPVGSTDGSVWNAMFVFNGVGKAAGEPNRVPGGPGLFRLFVSTGWHYDRLFGCVLIAAFAIGGAAALNGRLARRRDARGAGGALGDAGGALGDAGGALRDAIPNDRSYGMADPRADRTARAFPLAVGVWLAGGFVLFDAMGTVHARYLETFSPAVAMAIGLGATRLAGFGATGRGERRPAIAATTVALALVCAYSFHFRLPSTSWGALSLLVAAIGAALLASAPGRVLGAARWLVAGLVVACALAYPVHETLSLVRTDANDSLGLAVTTPGDARALSRFLEPRTRGERYELAVDEPLSLAPLIITDQRPILPLTSFQGRRLVSLSTLERAVRRGEVRYGLVSNYACTSAHRRFAACVPASRWIRRVGVDVTRDVTGLTGRERLYRLP